MKVFRLIVVLFVLISFLSVSCEKENVDIPVIGDEIDQEEDDQNEGDENGDTNNEENIETLNLLANTIKFYDHVYGGGVREIDILSFAEIDLPEQSDDNSNHTFTGVLGGSSKVFEKVGFNLRLQNFQDQFGYEGAILRFKDNHGNISEDFYFIDKESFTGTPSNRRFDIWVSFNNKVLPLNEFSIISTPVKNGKLVGTKELEIKVKKLAGEPSMNGDWSAEKLFADSMIYWSTYVRTYYPEVEECYTYDTGPPDFNDITVCNTMNFTNLTLSEDGSFVINTSFDGQEKISNGYWVVLENNEMLFIAKRSAENINYQILSDFEGSTTFKFNQDLLEINESYTDPDRIEFFPNDRYNKRITTYKKVD
ncbi:hypothetical protein GCM10009430_07360 [Aquimarina litoralis]|uniref:TolB-like 6-blade propeller-like n=1 Tax=Aquimarina litoralis TaxID=584605 RepID=A0ABP3TSW0_9FLAO